VKLFVSTLQGAMTVQTRESNTTIALLAAIQTAGRVMRQLCGLTRRSEGLANVRRFLDSWHACFKVDRFQTRHLSQPLLFVVAGASPFGLPMCSAL
jgi:hypothetical protein